jgi:hypothetical protein
MPLKDDDKEVYWYAGTIAFAIAAFFATVASGYLWYGGWTIQGRDATTVGWQVFFWAIGSIALVIGTLAFSRILVNNLLNGVQASGIIARFFAKALPFLYGAILGGVGVWVFLTQMHGQIPELRP